MDKQIVVHSYDGILLSNKKEWNADKHNDVDESQKHAEWKKSDTK